MSESEVQQEKSRRWSAFVCPDCRFVFRVPRDHDGHGIVCPSCRRMLRIPMPGDQTAPLVAPLKKIGFAGAEPTEEKRTRGKKKKKEKEAEQPGWDASAGTWRSETHKGKETAMTLAIWIGSMAAVVGLIALIMKFTDGDESERRAAALQGQDDFDGPVKNPLLIAEEDSQEKITLPKVMEKSETQFLTDAAPLAEKFLTASHVDEMLPLIHDRERVAPLLRAHYPGGKIEPVGMSRFNPDGRASYKDSFAAITVLTPDYEKRQLAFIDGKDGLKIDWESWVGWSEMPWKDLKTKRPVKPVIVRALVKWVDYYNFGFSDEGAWRSYRLHSPDGETTLYGYVERNSLLDQRLRPGEQGATVAVTLKIRYRKDEKSPDQVLIDEYVSDGWVVTNAPE